MPMTANGSGGRSDAQRGLEARLGEHGELALGRFEPREPEQVARRDPEQLPALEAAEPLAALLVVAAPLERVERVADQFRACVSRASASSSSRASTNSGWRRSASPTTRLEPSRWHVRSAAPGASRNVIASDADRAGPSTSRRSCRSPRSGSGVSDSHSRITGSSSCMTRDRRVRPAAQLAHRGAGALDVGEAERGEPFLGGFRGQRAGAGERLEQWREEEALVDAPHRPLVLPVLGLEPLERGPLGAVAVAEDTREPHQRLLVGRDEVGLLLVVELEAVLDGAQELVGAVEAIDVGSVDVATVGELVRARRASSASGRVSSCAPVHELQQLHRELDVADAAAPALQLAFAETLPLGDLLGALLHRADLADRVGVELLGPHARRAPAP